MFNVLESPREVNCSAQKCRHKGIISKGEQRITANLGTGNYPLHYHLDCFAYEHSEEIKKLQEILDGEMALAELMKQKTKIEERINEKIGEMGNLNPCNCDARERETVELIHKGNFMWEITSYCVKCGGYVEHD